MYIKIGIFILVITIVVVVMIYTQKSKSSSSPSSPPSPSPTPHAPLVEKCGGVVAPNNLKNPVCVRGKWVEHGSDVCEGLELLLPSNIGNCALEDLKCDNELKMLYCETTSECQNGGKLYFDPQRPHQRGKCACKGDYQGNNCQYTSKNVCGDGTTAFGNVNDKGECSCFAINHYGTHCEKQCAFGQTLDASKNCVCDLTLFDQHGDTCTPKRCGKNGTFLKKNDVITCVCDDGYYGSNCDITCGKNQVFDSSISKCICTGAYEPDVNSPGNCVAKKCGNGVYAGKNNCVCNRGFSKDANGQCTISICKGNTIWDDPSGSCVCPSNKDGLQYYTKDSNCVEYHCPLSKEFVVDKNGNPTCDCTLSDDPSSCGETCQYTRKNTCNDRGIPHCSGTDMHCGCDDSHSCGRFCEHTRSKCSDHGDPVCDESGNMMTCKCDAGFYGSDCSCTTPKPDGNHCLGTDYVCEKGTWKQTYATCNDIKRNYGSISEWNKACGDSLIDKTKYSGAAIMDCKDGYPVTPVIVGCPPLSSQNGCKSGQVNVCDNSTDYTWKCKEQIQNDGTCPPLPKGVLCMDQNGKEDKPVCFNCGSSGSEWVCQNEGGKPSLSCLQKMGIAASTTYQGYPGSIYIDGNTGLPIYPTTDYDACLNYLTNNSKNPFSNGQIGNINVTTMLGNPQGTINVGTKVFNDLSDSTKNRYFDANGTRCLFTDDEAIRIMKGDSKLGLCNTPHGTFQQDSHLPNGKCVCLDNYKGTNCQYSDKDTCNGKGTVDENGKCTCDKDHTGNYCEKTITTYKIPLKSASNSRDFNTPVKYLYKDVLGKIPPPETKVIVKGLMISKYFLSPNKTLFNGTFTVLNSDAFGFTIHERPVGYTQAGTDPTIEGTVEYTLIE